LSERLGPSGREGQGGCVCVSATNISCTALCSVVLYILRRLALLISWSPGQQHVLLISPSSLFCLFYADCNITLLKHSKLRASVFYIENDRVSSASLFVRLSMELPPRCLSFLRSGSPFESRHVSFVSIKRRNCFVNSYCMFVTSRGSVIGIPIGYGLDDRGVGVRVPGRARCFSFLLSLCPTQPLWSWN
jgi:hypothetical protein